MMVQSKKIIAHAAAVAAVLLGMGAAASAQAQTTPFYACVLLRGDAGQLRMVNATEVCRSNETRIQWNLVGAPGPVGAAGPVGPAGSPGTVGPAGAAGSVGAQGAAGPAGPVGNAGPLGSAGPAGVAGSQGPIGPAGAAGSTGAQGAPGPVGPIGNTGPLGDAGPAGVAGTQGPIGPAGAAGAAGAQGAVGSAGPIGAAGLLGAVGPGGPAGAPGPAGSTGAQGPTGPLGVVVVGPQGVTGGQGPRGPDGQLAPSGAIQGTLTCNAPTAAPAGSLVHVPGRAFTAYTGTGGAFQIDYVPAGTYSVEAVVTGQAAVTRSGVAVASTAVNLGSIEACASSLPCGVVCSGTKPVCYSPLKKCVQCITNSDCKSPLAPICTSFICGNGGVF